MAEYTQFDRQFRMAAGQPGKTGFEIGEMKDPTEIPLNIEFSFEKTDLSTQNNGRITVWNLNKSHIAVLNEKNCLVTFRAGYGKQLPLIFAGSVTYVSTERDGASEKTEIELVDNLIAVRDTYVSVSYNGTVNWKKIFTDSAAQMGVAISFSHNASFVNVPNGFSFVGPAKDILNKGCNCCGLSWSIQNGILQIKRPGDTMSREVFLLDADSGLVGSPKRVVIAQDDSGKPTQYGWEVDYFLNGAITVNDFVKLESRKISGYFLVQSVQYTGGNRSGDWMCTSRLMEVKG